MDEDNGVLPWPAGEGMWMVEIPGVEGAPACWFPLKTIELKGDLPHHPDYGKTIAVLAQFPVLKRNGLIYFLPTILGSVGGSLLKMS
jgi:hypothetical protein